MLTAEQQQQQEQNDGVRLYERHVCDDIMRVRCVCVCVCAYAGSNNLLKKSKCLIFDIYECKFILICAMFFVVVVIVCL